MLQQESPEDFVIGTGESHSVKEFLDLAFACLDLDWHDYVKIDTLYYRPAEVDHLVAETSKARKQLKWHHRVEFPEVVKILVQAEMDSIAQEPPTEDRKRPGDRLWATTS